MKRGFNKQLIFILFQIFLFVINLQIGFAQPKIYWSNQGTDNSIYRANLDGSNIEKIFQSGPGEEIPGSLVIDDINNKLYWYDVFNLSLKRSDLDGSNLESVIDNVPNGLFSLNINPFNGKLYWIDFDLQINEYTIGDMSPNVFPKVAFGITVAPQLDIAFFGGIEDIFEISLDDLNFNEDVYIPFDALVDALGFNHATTTLYWHSFQGNSIKRRNYFSPSPENTFIQFSPESFSPKAFTFDRSGDNVFWADGSAAILRANTNLPMTSPIEVIKENPGRTEDPVSIAVSCGFFAPDTDDDGTPDCADQCPNDSNKTTFGFCGCGNLETDTDADGTPDCVDQCPNDSSKTAPGVCGCGKAEVFFNTENGPVCGIEPIVPEDPIRILAPGTKITQPPIVIVNKRKVKLIFEKFSKAELKKKKKQKSSIEEFLLEAAKKKKGKISFRYSVVLRNKSSKTRNIINTQSKRNTLTIKNLAPGNYNVRYRAEILKGGQVAGKTNLSPAANFSIR